MWWKEHLPLNTLPPCPWHCIRWWWPWGGAGILLYPAAQWNNPVGRTRVNWSISFTRYTAGIKQHCQDVVTARQFAVSICRFWIFERMLTVVIGRNPKDSNQDITCSDLNFFKFNIYLDLPPEWQVHFVSAYVYNKHLIFNILLSIFSTHMTI